MQIYIDLYREKIIEIPTPRFIIFYNSEKKRPEKEEGILAEFLSENRAEAMKVSIYVTLRKVHMICDT
jgi:hypothetical protein